MMEDKGRLMKYSTFLNSAILELFVFSFSGNQLIDEVSVKTGRVTLIKYRDRIGSIVNFSTNDSQSDTGFNVYSMTLSALRCD